MTSYDPNFTETPTCLMTTARKPHGLRGTPFTRPRAFSRTSLNDTVASELAASCGFPLRAWYFGVDQQVVPEIPLPRLAVNLVQNNKVIVNNHCNPWTIILWYMLQYRQYWHVSKNIKDKQTMTITHRNKVKERKMDLSCLVARPWNWLIDSPGQHSPPTNHPHRAPIHWHLISQREKSLIFDVSGPCYSCRKRHLSHSPRATS